MSHIPHRYDRIADKLRDASLAASQGDSKEKREEGEKQFYKVLFEYVRKTERFRREDKVVLNDIWDKGRWETYRRTLLSSTLYPRGGDFPECDKLVLVLSEHLTKGYANCFVPYAVTNNPTGGFVSCPMVAIRDKRTSPIIRGDWIYTNYWLRNSAWQLPLAKSLYERQDMLDIEMATTETYHEVSLPTPTMQDAFSRRRWVVSMFEEIELGNLWVEMNSAELEEFRGGDEDKYLRYLLRNVGN